MLGLGIGLGVGTGPGAWAGFSNGPKAKCNRQYAIVFDSRGEGIGNRQMQ